MSHFQNPAVSLEERISKYAASASKEIGTYLKSGVPTFDSTQQLYTFFEQYSLRKSKNLLDLPMPLGTYGKINTAIREAYRQNSINVDELSVQMQAIEEKLKDPTKLNKKDLGQLRKFLKILFAQTQ